MVYGDFNSQPRILPAGPEDLPAIAALARVIWQAHYPGIISQAQIEYMLGWMYGLEQLGRDLAEGICYDRLLEGDELVAFAGYGPAAPGEMKLHKLYVHPAHQRAGLGSRLLRHVETISGQRRFTTLVLTVNKKNQGAIAAYLKNGFRIREAVVVEIGSGFVMDDYVLEKRLKIVDSAIAL